MKSINLCIEKDQEVFADFKNTQLYRIQTYYQYLLNAIEDVNIKHKIKTNFDNLEVYIRDKQSTLIPRTYLGKDEEFNYAARAFAFQRDISEKNEYLYVKPGLVINIKDKQLSATLYHELNHIVGYQLTFKDESGYIYKLGTSLTRIEPDRNIDLTGNVLNEGITDALAEHYVKINKYSHPEITSYGPNPYDTSRLFSHVLLGNNCDNSLLLQAYFGEVKDLEQFQDHFNSVMKEDNVTFQQLLDMSFKHNFNSTALNDLDAFSIACKYRYNLCKQNELDFQQESRFIYYSTMQAKQLFANNPEYLELENKNKLEQTLMDVSSLFGYSEQDINLLKNK